MALIVGAGTHARTALPLGALDRAVKIYPEVVDAG